MVLRLQVMPGPVEDLLGHLAGQLGVEGPQVDQHQVVVGPPRDQPETLGRPGPRPRARALATTAPAYVGELGLGPPRRRPPPWPPSRARAGRPGGPGTRRCRSPWPARPGTGWPRPAGPRSVLWVVKVTTSATPTGLGWTPPAIRPAGWAASNMKQRADRVGDLPERLRVDDPRVGGGPGHDQLGPLALGQVGHLVEVDDLARPVGVVAGRGHAVGHEAPDLARDRGRRAVGEVAALVEPHGQHGVARLERGPGRRPGWRWRPAWGWTLACSAPKSAMARSRARSSTSSMIGSRRSSAAPGTPRRTC